MFSRHLECHHRERWPKSDWVSEDLRHQNKPTDENRQDILRSQYLYYIEIVIPAEMIPLARACAILPAPMKPTLADDKSIFIRQVWNVCQKKSKATDDSAITNPFFFFSSLFFFQSAPRDFFRRRRAVGALDTGASG